MAADNFLLQGRLSDSKRYLETALKECSSNNDYLWLASAFEVKAAIAFIEGQASTGEEEKKEEVV